MSQNYQTVERRKDNISSIEPLISAMRTISLSQWRMALNRQTTLDAFLNELKITSDILNTSAGNVYAQDMEINHDILIILGSNRGLCGNFNKRLRHFIQAEEIDQRSYNRIYLVGKQLPALYKNIEHWTTIDLSFPDFTAIPSASSLFSLDTPNTLAGSSVTVAYNAYLGASRFDAAKQQIYPLQPSNRLESQSAYLKAIIDTDAHNIRKTIEFMQFNSHLQACLYSSMASEHSSRFALMENADQNIENLITELEIILQDFRKGKITTETQELAVSSGLLKTD